MPSLPSVVSEALLVLREDSAPTTGSPSDEPLQVICAWPMSGHYGPGSRALFYALIATCVFAKRAEWLKGPCLAAALLFPAVASLHGITLAVLHREGAVDLDIYGAFQLCTIGILVAPVTVTLSKTYFNSRGRNTIFIWLGITLAGLLSLTIEFYRIDSHPCLTQIMGQRISSDPDKFPYDSSPSCDLVCSVDDGPFSPLRRGSADNIYVIPVPDNLSFGTGTLISAACCVHGMLWLFFMMDKILNRDLLHKLRGDSNDDEAKAEAARLDRELSGTNGATEGHMMKVNSIVIYFLTVAVIPIFGGLSLALLIFGERNLFSKQLMYQTEPMSTVGQWSPIAYTVFAIVGSLINLLASDLDRVNRETEQADGQMQVYVAPSLSGPSSIHRIPSRSPSQQRSPDPTGEADPLSDKGGRRRAAQFFKQMGDHIGVVTNKYFDQPEFDRKAREMPTVPGESGRNARLPALERQYSQGEPPDTRAASVSRSGRSGSFHRGRSITQPGSPDPSFPEPQRALLRPDTYSEANY